MESNRICILYLGQRGGGAQLALQISQELNQSAFFQLKSVGLRADNYLANQFAELPTRFIFNSGNSLRSAMKVLRYLLQPAKLLNDLNIGLGEICLVPMISPLGNIVERLLESKGIAVVRFLHDARRHPGDIWPTNRVIKKIIKKSDTLICLSASVAEDVKKYNPSTRIGIYKHPVFNFTYSHSGFDLPNPYFLFIGRIRDYKGVENLLHAYSGMEEPKPDLVIAGEGKIHNTLQIAFNHIPGWLRDEEVAELIHRAKVVVFPYIEASQSGLLPYCVANGKKVVITPLEGLLEQTEGYKNAFTAKDFSIPSLGEALSRAVEASNSELSDHKNLNPDSIEATLRQILNR